MTHRSACYSVVRSGLAAALLLCTSLTVTPAGATEIIDSEFSTCDEVDCSTTSIAGWVGSAAGKVKPWTATFLATAGACLRLKMNFIATDANLETVVVAPNGLTRWRNDQGGVAGCTNCSLVKIPSAPITGFYTVVISTGNGAVADTDFHLWFGQYNGGNPNCTPGTPTVAAP